MEIYSLSEQLRVGEKGLYDLFRPTIVTTSLGLEEYVVKKEEEMRVDILFQNIYELSSDVLYNYIKDVDILLAINNIDNPMNIKEGMVIRYPRIGEFESYRAGESELSKAAESSIARLSVPNKKTKADPNREKYLQNNNSLPPTANNTPKQPITFDGKNNTLLIGGL